MRKQRTREEGLALARAYQSSGLKLGDFSKRHGVTECSVQYWNTQLRKIGLRDTGIGDAQFVEVKSKKTATPGSAARVTVGTAEISFLSLPEASWMSEFVVTVNRYS
jgi:hypothetical protein